MSSRAYFKRNRPVTACRECHRRKQKCDRQKPCNVCLARNVPEKCLYGDELQRLVDASKQTARQMPLTPPLDPDSPPEHTLDLSANTLEDQFGYSATSSNAFSDLYKSIDAVHIPSAGALGLSTATLKPSVKARYLKIVSQLPSKSVCSSLIDLYFREANWYYVAIDRYYFNRLHVAWNACTLPEEASIKLEQYPRDLQHFPALLFQLLALALHFYPLDSDLFQEPELKDCAEREKTSQLYSELGEEIMTIMGRQNPSITGVEHELLRMAWLKNVSRGTESWHTVGNAVMLAQDLGLHLDSDMDTSNGDILLTPEQLWYEEYKRRVWARVFLLDSNMALVLGRPRRIHLDDCTAQCPINCDVPDRLANTRPAVPGPDEVPSSFSAVVFLQQMGLKIHEVMSARSKKAFYRDHSKIEQVHLDVEAMLNSLPPTTRPHNPDTSWDQRMPHFPKVRQQILTSAHFFFMKLHRPYIDVNDISRDAIVKTALATLDSQQEFFELMIESTNQYRIYGFSFYTIDAAILLAALIISQWPHDPDLLDHVNLSLQQAIHRMGLLRDVSLVAASGEKLLMPCYAKIIAQQPRLSPVQKASEPPYISSEPFFSEEELSFVNNYNMQDPLKFAPDMFAMFQNGKDNFANVNQFAATS